MVGRPPKYKRGRVTSVYADEIDLKYLDDHRGKLSRSEYLIEAMYALKGDTRIQEVLALLKLKDKEIYELREQLRFEKFKKQKQEASGALVESSEILEKWWKEYENKIEDAYRRHTEPSWKSIYITALDKFPGIPFNSPQAIKEFVEEKKKNNGGAATTVQKDKQLSALVTNRLERPPIQPKRKGSAIPNIAPSAPSLTQSINKCVRGIVVEHSNLTPKCSFECALEHGCEIQAERGTPVERPRIPTEERSAQEDVAYV